MFYFFNPTRSWVYSERVSLHELFVKVTLWGCVGAAYSSFTIFDQHSVNYRTVQVDFQLSSFNFLSNFNHMVSHALSPVVLILKGLYFGGYQDLAYPT